jgi:hypothetical protein
MALKDELCDEVAKVFRSTGDTTDGRVVPDVEDLSLGNAAKKFEDAVVLYADMAHRLANQRPYASSLGQRSSGDSHCPSRLIYAAPPGTGGQADAPCTAYAEDVDASFRLRHTNFI